MTRPCRLPAIVCLLAAAVLLPVRARAGVSSPRLEFASAEAGRHRLTKVDDFVLRLSPFDRAARLKSGQPVSQGEYLKHVATCVKEWSPEEKMLTGRAVESLGPGLAALNLTWPEPVWLVRTTGGEEGNAAYTRGDAIVLPDSQFDDAGLLAGLLAHELFHVLSRHHPELRDALYGVIGFKPCAEVTFSPELAEKKITNPDAPRNDHAIELTVSGTKRWMVPVLISRTARYDAAAGGEFFASMEFLFAPAGSPRPVSASDLVPRGAVGGFDAQIGQNTGYVIHPEEILADNFKLMLTRSAAVRTPRIIGDLRRILSEAGAKKPAR